MPQITYQMLRDFMSLPESERVAVASDPSETGQMMNDFLNLGGEGRRDVLDSLRPAAQSSNITVESIKRDVGPFNPLEYLKHPAVASTATRVGPALAGGIAGARLGAATGIPLLGLAGGAIGSGVGYAADKLRRGEEVNPLVLAVEALLGGIPGGKTASTMLRNVANRAGLGAVLGVTGQQAVTGIEEGRLLTPQEALFSAGAGGVTGGALGGGEHWLFGPRPAPPLPPPPPSGPRALRGPIAALPPATNPPTVDASPLPGLSDADIITAQRGMTKRGRALDAKTMKEAMRIAEEDAKRIKDAEKIARKNKQTVQTVVLPRPWENLPDAPPPPTAVPLPPSSLDTPESRIFRSLSGKDFQPTPPVEQPAGMNVMEAVDLWNPRAVAMREALTEAERVNQSPAGREGLLRFLTELDRPPAVEPPPPPRLALPPAPAMPVTPEGQVIPRTPLQLGMTPKEIASSQRILAGGGGHRLPPKAPQIAAETPQSTTPLDIPTLVARIDELKSAGKTVPVVLREELARARKNAKAQITMAEPLPTPLPTSFTPPPLPKPKAVKPSLSPQSDISPEVSNRMELLRMEVDDARTNLPTGKIFGTTEGETGMIQKHAIGAGQSIREQLSPLYPELKALPNVGPKEIVTAIEKDKGNKLYLQIKDEVTSQLERERATEMEGAASRAAEDAAYEARLAAEDAGISPIKAPPGTQPRLIQTQAELPPTPLQAKAQQVPHKELLGGFRPPEPPAPELPLQGAKPPSGVPSGTVELGMGLPIPKGVKERVRRWVNRAPTAYAPVDRPSAELPVEQPRPTAGVRHRLGTIFDRALGHGEGKKFADMVDYSEMWTERDNLRFSDTPLLKLSDAELVNAMQAGEGRAKPLNARVAQFVQDGKAYLSEKSRDLIKNKAEVLEDAIYEAGAGGAVLKSGRWRPYQPLPNYFFQQGIDFTRAAKYDVPTLTRFLRRDIPELGGQGANEMAEAIIAQAKGRPLTKPLGGPVEQILRRAQPTNPSLHSRTGIRIPDEIRILPDKSIPLYVNRINKDLAALQTYGPRDAGIENVMTRAFGERRNDAALAKEQWDIWRGRNVLSPSAQSVSWWQRALNNIVSVQLTGPLTAIRQTSQIGPVATMLPPKHLAQGLASAFTKTGWRGAQFAGALTSDMMEELSRQRTLGETISHAHTGTEKALAVTGRAAQVWGQATGQRFMDAYFRVVAQAGAKSWFRELQTDALAGNAKSLAELKRWGLTPTSAGDELLVATKRASDYANRRAGPQNMPVYYYQKGGLGELSRHLNSFSMSSANYVLDGLRSLTSALGRRDSAETIRMLKLMAKGAVIWQGTGEVLGDVIRTAQGRPDDRPGGTPVEFVGDLAKGIVPPQTVINRIVDNYLFSGPLAMLNNLKEAVLYVQGGPRESQARLISQIVGPAISSTAETVAKAGDVIRKELAGAPPPDAKRDPRVESRKMFAREVVRKGVPGGQVLAPIVMPASKSNDKKRAVAGFVRAERRGQAEDALDWLNWYQEKQGKPLSPRTIRRGLQESGQ